jgi:hypothetical protein
MSLSPTLRAIFLALSAVVALHAQQFQQPTVIPTGNWPSAIYSADLNGDRHPDLIYIDPGATSSASTTHILLNNGDGNFTAGQTIATAGTSIAIGDFDGDGHPDLAWVSYTAPMDSKAWFAKGDGSGGFATAIGASFAMGPNSNTAANFVDLAAGKLRDSGPDSLVFGDTVQGMIHALSLQPGAGFHQDTVLQTIDGVGPLSFADLDGDGHLDVMVKCTKNLYFDTFFGYGDGTLRAGTNRYTGSGQIFSQLFVDMDSDGHVDHLTEGAAGRIDIFHGNPDGTMTLGTEIGSGASDGTTGNGGHLIGVADLNGDGIPDILTSTPAGISVVLGTGNLSYKLGGIYNAGPGRSSYALADFNGDGHLDLAVDSPEGIAILFGNPDGSFQTSHSYAAGQPAYSLALGRFTASGNTDAVVATGVPQIQLLNGDGKGGFTAINPPMPSEASQTNAARNVWSNVLAGDFDGDGNLDVAITPAVAPFPLTLISPLTIDFGNGAGIFSVSKAEGPAGYLNFGASAIGDFNGDGASDIANYNPEGCNIYAGGSSARTGITLSTILDNHVSSADYNLVATGFLVTGHTNMQDVVCQDNGTLHVYRNTAGTFIETATIAPPPGFATIDSSGVFPATGLFPGALLFADLDADGHGDLIVTYHNLASDPAHPLASTGNQIYIYWGNGDGTFSAPQILTPSRNFYQATVADIGGDGKPDLIFSDGYLLSVLPGQGSARTFGAEQHYLAGMGINGLAATKVNGQTGLIVANGGAVLSNPAVNRGTLASNAEVNTGGITVLLNNSLRPAITNASGTVTSSPNTPEYGHAFTLTVVLTPPTPNSPIPTGSVDFSIDGTYVVTATLDSTGTATSAPILTAYSVGSHAVTATYAGDSHYTATTFTGTLTVITQPTTTYFTALDSPIYYGQIIGDTAFAHADPTETTSYGSTAGGSITVYIDGKNVCVLVVAVGQSACPSTTGAGYGVGAHTIYGTYSGNDFYAASTSVTSTVIIQADVTSQGTLTSSGNPAIVGTPVTFTAVFTAPFAIPTGPITFLDDTGIIATGTLDATGTATLTISNLALGTHAITATYAGNINFTAATTNVLQQSIVSSPLATTTILASSVNPSIVGQNVTFTAAVATTSASGLTPAGTIAFTIDGVTVSTATLNPQGSASFSISTLALGNHNVVAMYSGTTVTTSSNFNASTSVTVVQVVNPVPAAPSFTLTVTPAALSVPIGNSASVLVSITALNGFNQPVVLSCGSLPREVTCTFGTATLVPGQPSTTLQVFATAPHDCGSTEPYFISSGPTTWLGLLATSGLIVLVRRRRRLVQGIVLTLALCILPIISGCGNCTDLGVWPGNYTFTVSGTTGSTTPSTSVNATETQTIKMVAHL